MRQVLIPPELRPWVERTAPRLTVDDWREAERIAKLGSLRFGHSGTQAHHWKWSIGEARALLAYRDKVVAGLGSLRRYLRGAVSGLWGQIGARLSDLEGHGFVKNATLTPWGRVIAERARELAAK